MLLFAAASSAWAGGPRWVTGAPYYTQPGSAIIWQNHRPQYFTDPGDLSPSVSHAAADAIVAAAASVWNVPASAWLISQGGTLSEHVSSANVSNDANGAIAFPHDVNSSNAANIPIAVLYDTDGSITDLLLGTGASDPALCRQNAVTEDVDSITPAGFIEHAILLINGRCSGPDPRQQLQLQYQLMRAFGRIAGVGWSQTNDNVFTRIPTPTFQQAQYWPIMHPIDLVCGSYTYLCLPDPFKLRPDDIAAITQLYYMLFFAEPGKVLSPSNAARFAGQVTFATGQGMSGVNVVGRPRQSFTPTSLDFELVSATSGFLSIQQAGNPVTGPPPSDPYLSLGTTSASLEGVFYFPWVPIIFSDNQTLDLASEAINPLYTGAYSVGPYSSGSVSPSGDPLKTSVVFQTANDARNIYLPPQNASPSSCNTARDGAETSPAAVDPSGWWTGALCPYGHTAWSSLTVRAGHSLTLEVTATDDAGKASTVKLRPVIGLWNSSDPVGTLPTVASAPVPFNALTLGMTTLTLPASTTDAALRLVLADDRGDGRPDFTYQARLLYTGAVQPAQVPAAGGSVTITGMGFREGNGVLVNGVDATVTSWSATALTVTVPPLRDLPGSPAKAASVDVTVFDHTTGASSTITAGLRYSAPIQQALEITSTPLAPILSGIPNPSPFTVKLLTAGTTTSIAGELVTFTSDSPSTLFSGCGAATCTVLTDAQGLASMLVTPGPSGALHLTATSSGSTITAPLTIQPATPDTLRFMPSLPATAEAGKPLQVSLQLLYGDGTPIPSTTIRVSASNLQAGTNAPASATTNASGSATFTLTPGTPGTLTLSASALGLETISQITVTPAQPDLLTITSAPPASLQIGTAAPFTVRLLKADGLTPRANAAVLFSYSGGSVQFSACNGTSTCAVVTDASGFASIAGTPTVAGPILFTASVASNALPLSVSASSVAVSALARILRIVSAPTGPLLIGNIAPAFTVQLLEPDGSIPVAGAAVTLAASGGGVQVPFNFGLTYTDAGGLVSLSVTPTQLDTATLSATSSGSIVSASFSVVPVPPSRLKLLSPQTSTSVLNAPVAPLVLQALDGLGHPLVHQVIVFTIGGGNTTFDACNFQYSCGVYTDDHGMASMSVTPHSLGQMILGAFAPGFEASLGNVSETFQIVSSLAPGLSVLSIPAGTIAGSPINTPFTVRLIAADGVTPVVGSPIRFLASGAGASACASQPCSANTDARGIASAVINTMGDGLVTLTAYTSPGLSSVAGSFTAVQTLPDLVTVTAAPPSVLPLGTAATLALQVIGGNDHLVLAGVPIFVSTSGSPAQLGSCSATPACELQTDAQGQISTTVTAMRNGPVTINVTAQLPTGTQTFTASFLAIDPTPRQLSLISAPTGQLSVDLPAASAFAVQVTNSAGVVSSDLVTLTATHGSVAFAACPGFTVCTLPTDAQGIVSTGITPLAPGPITLEARAEGNVLSSSFTATSLLRSLTAARTAQYIAAQQTAHWAPTLRLTQNGAPVSSEPILWSIRPIGPALLSQFQTSTDSAGASTNELTAGPLPTGGADEVDACTFQASAAGPLCVQLVTIAVDPSELRVNLVSGAGQAMSLTSSPGAVQSFQPVVLRITDIADNPILGAPVTIHQTVEAWQPPCPARGRCPVAAPYDASTGTLVTDANGQVTIHLLESGLPERTRLAVSTGTQGFLTLSATKSP